MEKCNGIGSGILLYRFCCKSLGSNWGDLLGYFGQKYVSLIFMNNAFMDLLTQELKWGSLSATDLVGSFVHFPSLLIPMATTAVYVA